MMKNNEIKSFQSIDAAKKFTYISLRNSRFFVSDEDRFSMQYLADVLRFALENDIMVPDDLYLTENEVIKKLNRDKKLSEMWKSYTELSAVATSTDKLDNRYCINVSAKKRFIDSLVLVNSNAKRLTDIDIDTRDQIQEFLNIDFNKWVYAV